MSTVGRFLLACNLTSVAVRCGAGRNIDHLDQPIDGVKRIGAFVELRVRSFVFNMWPHVQEFSTTHVPAPYVLEDKDVSIALKLVPGQPTDYNCRALSQLDFVDFCHLRYPGHGTLKQRKESQRAGPFA